MSIIHFGKCYVLLKLPALAACSCCLVIKRYLGDSGQNGSSANCSTDGNSAIPNKYGQPLSVPKRPSTPSICDTRRPTVTASWLIVPKPPRRVNGAISEMYMGTKDVFKPEKYV